MLLSNSETKPINKEETFETNEFSDGNFVGVHDIKNEIFESELDITSESLQSECEFGKDPLYVSVNSEKKYQEKQKPFKCTVCSASFARNSHLTQHIESVHEGKKPFKCKICDAGFTAKQSLKWHISSIHEGNKSFKCSFCKANFSLKCNLDRHIASVHEKVKPFDCNICDATFSLKSNLNTHIAMVHTSKIFPVHEKKKTLQMYNM